MRKKDLISVAVLIAITILLYSPLFYAEYAYTDELVQLWWYKKGTSYNMFVPLGRNIADILFNRMFSSIDTIKSINYLRLFSLFGWICCIPVWYYVIQQIVRLEGLPPTLAFFTVLYLVTCPAFTVSVQWASCMELFIANTCGLMAGFVLYSGIKYTDGRVNISTAAVLFSALPGVIALFTYQNGFGCFFIPVLLHLIARKHPTKKCFISIIVSLFIFLAYYFLFKYSLKVYAVVPSERSGISFDPWIKLVFFFTRPMVSAFHFSFLFNERSMTGAVAYAILFGCWMGFVFFKRLSTSLKDKLLFFTALFIILLLIYLPSLLVKENYSSNRTLLALDMAVFTLFFETLLSSLKNNKSRLLMVAMVSVLFIFNAWYNFTYQFLLPVKREYAALRSFIDAHYSAAIQTIYFIQPREDLFQREYHITASWDEFAVPSSFFGWVPEFFCRQLVYEKTKNRRLAENLIIKSWPGKTIHQSASGIINDSVLVVDAEQVIIAWNKRQQAYIKDLR